MPAVGRRSSTTATASTRSKLSPGTVRRREGTLPFPLALTLLPTPADYGESSYVGPIQGDQPNSQAWVDGFDHTALLAINKYYSTAFKTGSYPPITENVIYLSARPHSGTATASADPIGRPTGGQNGDPNGYLWTPDEFYALVFATQAGEVTLTSGSNIKKVAVSAGVNFLSQTLQVGAGMSASFNGVSCSPRFTCECAQPPDEKTEHADADAAHSRSLWQPDDVQVTLGPFHLLAALRIRLTLPFPASLVAAGTTFTLRARNLRCVLVAPSLFPFSLSLSPPSWSIPDPN